MYMIITSSCRISRPDDLKHLSYTEEAIKAINGIPKDKLILMDNNNLEIEGNIVEIYQDF